MYVCVCVCEEREEEREDESLYYQTATLLSKAEQDGGTVVHHHEQPTHVVLEELRANIQHANILSSIQANILSSIQANILSSIQANIQSSIQANILSSIQANIQSSLPMLCWKNSEHRPLFASSGQEMTMNCTVDEDCVCSEDVSSLVGRDGGGGGEWRRKWNKQGRL